MTVVAPAYELAAVRITVPAPVLVRSASPEPAMMPATVSVFPLSVLIVASAEPRVTPRLASRMRLVPVASSVPPLSVSWSAAAVTGAAPRLLSAETLSVPPVTDVLPV